jgi:hypothetical protein
MTKPAPTTFATTVKAARLTIRRRTARCAIDGTPFRFSVTLRYRPNGTALTMEAYHVIVRTAALAPTTAEGIAAAVRRMARATLPDATKIGVVVCHAANRDGVALEVRA